jgi:PAS domain S-box-containing protein
MMIQINKATFTPIPETMQEGYQEAIERIRDLYDNAPCGYHSLNEDGVFVEINQTELNWLGYARSEMINKMRITDVLAPSSKGVFKERFPEFLSQNHIKSLELEFMRKDGSTFYGELSATAKLNEDGKLLMTRSVVTDITEKKKTELNLQYKITELNTFMYKASHDLRAPLSSLLGLINIASTLVSQTELKEYFRMIDESTRKMDKILIDLVDITKISQGVPDVREVKLEELVLDVLSSLENTPEFRDIQFSMDILQTRSFYSDPNLIHSVIQNLLDNSAKYRSAGKECFIRVEARETANSLKIKISDNGIGIPPLFHKKVFDMFYRATTVSSGTGLGLYIAKNAIEKLGGTIELESTEDVGTAFYLELPETCLIQ